jgi:tetratricopeptide (TPR) repeat protein
MLYEGPHSSPQDYFKTVLVHLLLVSLYSLLYQGAFLLIYPPTCLFFIGLCLLLSTMHRRAHRLIQATYVGEWFLVQIWLQPLLFMGILVAASLCVMSLAEASGQASVFRQIFQLPVDVFTSFLYIFFLMIFSSGTYLFAESFCAYLMHLKPGHLGRRSRIVARLTLVAFVFLAVTGLWFIFAHRTSNLAYIQAMVYENFQKPREALKCYSQVPISEERLYQSARFRMARLELLRFRDYKLALKHFSEVITIIDSPLRDEAILQSMFCAYNLEGKVEELEQYFKMLWDMGSHLRDEAGFLLAQKLVLENRYQEAESIYLRLKDLPFWNFTVQSWLNTERRRFSPTAFRAKQELENLRVTKL